MASYYDGTRSMLFPKFFDYLKPGVEVDSMKGALWMIGSKAFGNLAVSDWRWTAQCEFVVWFLGRVHDSEPQLRTLHLRRLTTTDIIALLESQHQEKPSIQKLVREVSCCIATLVDYQSKIESEPFLPLVAHHRHCYSTS